MAEVFIHEKKGLTGTWLTHGTFSCRHHQQSRFIFADIYGFRPRLLKMKGFIISHISL